MTVTQYLSSLPMDTKYYLLDHSSEPDKVKEVLKEKAKDSAFLAELIKHIQTMQEDRIAQQAQRVAANEAEFKPRMDLIQALSMTPFTKRCRRCSRIIDSGEYCPDCAKELASSKYTLSDY